MFSSCGQTGRCVLSAQWSGESGNPMHSYRAPAEVMNIGLGLLRRIYNCTKLSNWPIDNCTFTLHHYDFTTAQIVINCTLNYALGLFDVQQGPPDQSDDPVHDPIQNEPMKHIQHIVGDVAKFRKT